VSHLEPVTLGWGPHLCRPTMLLSGVQNKRVGGPQDFPCWACTRHGLISSWWKGTHESEVVSACSLLGPQY
jgi:hypothetical protein